jgi:hypothetical protein
MTNEEMTTALLHNLIAAQALRWRYRESLREPRVATRLDRVLARIKFVLSLF